MASFIQLQAQIEKLQKEAETLRKREVAETITNIKKAIAAFGLTAEDLGLTGRTSGKHGRKPSSKQGVVAGAKRRGRPAKSKGETAVKRSIKKSNGADKRSVVAPKYRDSITGATWTGRGKQPKWLAQALAGGKSLQDFII